MSIFIDTSAFYALLTSNDINHPKASKTWEALLESQERLITTNYIVLESYSLIQNRLGFKAVKDFQQSILPLIHIQWITESDHQAGVNALLVAGRKKLSLVDCVSFEVMRTLGIDQCFAFDKHFKEQGFDTI